MLSLASVWVGTLLLAGYLSIDLTWVYRDAETKGRQLATTHARLVSEHAAGTFDRVELLLERVVQLASAPEAGDLPALQKQLLAVQRRDPGIASITLADRNGRVFLNAETAPGAYIGDRDYFVALKGGAAEPVISEVVQGRVSKQWGLHVARTLRDSTGAFAGVAAINISMPSYLGAFYSSLGLPAGSVVSLWSGEHRAVVSYPDWDGSPARLMAADEVANLLSDGGETYFHGAILFDAVHRQYVSRQVPGYPIWAVVGLPDSMAFATAHQSLMNALGFLVVAIILSGLATMLTVLKHRAEDRAIVYMRVLRDVNVELERLATTDVLTGMNNRRAFFEKSEARLAPRTPRDDHNALLLADIDHFKRLNDTYGHATGDEALKLFSQTVQPLLTEGMVGGRLGGEEFSVFLPATTVETARDFAERLRQAVAAAELMVGTERIHFTISIGVTGLAPGDSVEVGLARADKALYEAKGAGRNRVVVAAA